MLICQYLNFRLFGLVKTILLGQYLKLRLRAFVVKELKFTKNSSMNLKKFHYSLRAICEITKKKQFDSYLALHDHAYSKDGWRDAVALMTLNHDYFLCCHVSLARIWENVVASLTLLCFCFCCSNAGLFKCGKFESFYT